jgi:predicted NUDIX family NTP pyrophosphohydrolase
VVGSHPLPAWLAALTMTKVRLVSLPRVSAGLLMFRVRDGQLQVLLAHPGGPFFKNKDDGARSIPKGEVEPGEDMLEAAKREFEETGVRPTGPFIALTPVKQKGGKVVHARVFKGECDPGAAASNTFTMEWPPRSGRRMGFPEIERADSFDVAAARQKIQAGQKALIELLNF